MDDIGIITGRAIGKNRDGDKNRVLLQVRMLDEDVRTVELFTQAGEDTNPANGCRVIVVTLPGTKGAVAVSDDLAPEVDPGEKEIYSTDNPATGKQARTLWDAAGNVVHNQGAKSATAYADLDTALQGLVTAMNLELQALGGAGALTLDISLAESPTVKIP